MSVKNERDDGGPDEYKCDNCGAVHSFEELGWIQSYSERVSAGNDAPAGECPQDECGALCYPVIKTNPLYLKLLEHVGHSVVVVTYGDLDNVSVECEDCNAVLVDADREDASA